MLTAHTQNVLADNLTLYNNSIRLLLQNKDKWKQNIEIIRGTVSLYADDTVLYTREETNSLSAALMQNAKNKEISGYVVSDNVPVM